MHTNKKTHAYVRSKICWTCTPIDTADGTNIRSGKLCWPVQIGNESPNGRSSWRTTLNVIANYITNPLNFTSQTFFFFCVPFKFCVHYFWVVWKVNLCRLLVILQVIFNLFFSLRFIYTQSPFVHPSHHLIHLCLNLFDSVLKCTRKKVVLSTYQCTQLCVFVSK